MDFIKNLGAVEVALIVALVVAFFMRNRLGDLLQKFGQDGRKKGRKVEAEEVDDLQDE